MEEAEGKLMTIVPASLALIFMLLYMAFGSVIDASLVLVNVRAFAGTVSAALLDRHEFQRLGGGRVHVDLRRRNHGRVVAGLVLQRHARRMGCRHATQFFKERNAGFGP